jgi:hypothetical protein
MGIINEEFEDIIKVFQKTKDRLAKMIERKKNENLKHHQAVIYHQNHLTVKESDIAKAERTIQKIEDIIN